MSVIGLTETSSSAIVIGASIAGLVTARVLSEHVDRVTVVERDGLPTQGGHPAVGPAGLLAARRSPTGRTGTTGRDRLRSVA